MTALLVIDMLEDFFQDDPLRSQRKELVAAINQLVRWSRERGHPVIWVRQEFKDDLSDAFPVMRQKQIRMTMAGTPGAEILSDLDRYPSDAEVIKKRYSAFHGTDLESELADAGITHLVLAGINTHACVRMAAIDAYQRDLEVTIVEDCVSSWDLEHHDVTLRYLGREIAQIVDLDDLLPDARAGREVEQGGEGLTP